MEEDKPAVNLAAFLKQDRAQVAELVREKGPRVAVCPINGTRRWFILENRRTAQSGDFLGLILGKYRELINLFFSHGLYTLLTPIIGPDIVRRGEDYLKLVYTALEAITTGPEFKAFYAEYDIRVRFYGDFEDFFEKHNPRLLALVRQVQAETRDHLRHRLLWGMFAQDPVERIAAEAIKLFESSRTLPRRSELVASYYGEFLPPADLFIGMAPPSAFDFPLLDSGSTALYFTTAPTPYLDETMVRRILFDFIYKRPVHDGVLDPKSEGWDELDRFYRAHTGEIYGLGRQTADGTIWLPLDPGDSESSDS